ncbi:hypothetical protein KY342_06930 [Candidatus Woesearchaeota archaeon]|nr:hypothetical protein [Candidatus Woesearchaeota archaeon]
MNINVIYGDEAISEDFLTELRQRGYSIKNLFDNDADSAAETFIDIAVQMDYLMEDGYYKNLGKLCLDLSKDHPEFYERLVEKIRKLDREIPSRAALLLYGL